MATVFDVAKYILECTGPIGVWKLHKLCYYSQAWTLAWDERPLFDDDFEAWSNGPVCRDLYCQHQGVYTLSPSDLQIGKSDALDKEQKGNIDIILRDYGDYLPYELREQTRSELPWLQARAGLPDDATSGAIISRESMGEYYGSL